MTVIEYDRYGQRKYHFREIENSDQGMCQLFEMFDPWGKWVIGKALEAQRAK